MFASIFPANRPRRLSGNNLERPMKQFVVSVILFSTLHYLILISLEGFAFLLAHLPPRIFHLDNVILVFYWIEKILSFLGCFCANFLGKRRRDFSI